MGGINQESDSESKVTKGKKQWLEKRKSDGGKGKKEREEEEKKEKMRKRGRGSYTNIL